VQHLMNSRDTWRTDAAYPVALQVLQRDQQLAEGAAKFGELQVLAQLWLAALELCLPATWAWLPMLRRGCPVQAG